MTKAFSIQVVTKADLIQGLQNDTYWKGHTVIPFTKSKAAWLCNKPDIEDTDVCAVLAYEADAFVGLVYLIPDYIKTQIGTVKKIYWCRRWWVATRFENTVMATYLMAEAVAAVSGQVLVKFLGKKVIPFYKKQPYTEFSHRNRYYLVFALDAYLLVNKLRHLQPLLPILKLAERLSGRWVRFWNSRRITAQTQSLHYMYLTQLDQPTWDFLSQRLQKDLVPKTRALLDWQLSKVQYTVTPVAQKFPHTCLVASAAAVLMHISFAIKKEDEIIGFISVQLRSKEFNVVYFVADAPHYSDCLAALVDHFNQTTAHTIHTENEQLAKQLIQKLKPIYVDQRALYGLVHQDVGIEASSLQIQDQDGHYA